MRGDRKILRRLLEERFIPLLEAKGFERLQLPEKDRQSGQMKWAFPLGRLRRIKGADHEVIEIQFDKYGGAKFRLAFGIVPPEGIDHPFGHTAQDEASVASVSEAYTLYSWRAGMKWFSPPWYSHWSDREAWIAKVVDRAIKLLTEVETWFETRKVGPHMRRSGYPLSPQDETYFRQRAEKLRAEDRLDG